MLLIGFNTFETRQSLARFVISPQCPAFIAGYDTSRDEYVSAYIENMQQVADLLRRLPDTRQKARRLRRAVVVDADEKISQDLLVLRPDLVRAVFIGRKFEAIREDGRFIASLVLNW